MYNKLVSLFLVGSWVFVLAACSSDEIGGPNSGNGNNNNNNDDPAQQTSSVSVIFNITTPEHSNANGRAVDGVATGTEAEFKVTDGEILLFEGADEADARFVAAAPLNLTDAESQNSEVEDLFTPATATFNELDIKDNSNYYGLVILNKGEGFTMPTEGQTFKNWSETAIENCAMKNGEGNFTMTNAPEYTSASGEPVTLVSLTKANFAVNDTPTQSAGTFYVQRGLAKVTVDAVAGASMTDMTVTNRENDKVTITNWILDVTNKTTFPVQIVSGLSTDFSQIWSKSYMTTGTNFKRVNWGEDPNYRWSSVSSTDFNVTSEDGVDVAWKNVGESDYCLENTFNAENMTQNQMTRVILKGEYKLNNVKESFFKVGSAKTLWTLSAFEEELKAKIIDVMARGGDAKTASVTSVPTQSGNFSLKSFGLQYDNINLTDENLEKVAALIAGIDASDQETISFYKEGVVYYKVLVKHFGDATPFDANTDVDTRTGKVKYTNAHLGRYGVLRNNFYEVAIKSVTNVGEPTIPAVPEGDEPADEIEQNQQLQVAVNILSWTKHSQEEDLK